MKRTLFGLFSLTVGLWGQTSPNCSQALTFTGATAGTAINTIAGAAAGCAGWRLTWSVTGFTAATIQLEGSQDNSTWAAFSGATIVLEGSNPTSWTSSTSSNTIVVRASLPYVRVNITGVTGSGTIKTLILGYSGTSAQLDNGSGGGGPTGPAGGDLSGTYPNPTVIQARGGKCTFDASGNQVCAGSYTSGSGAGLTGALDLTGATSGSTVTLTVSPTTTAGSQTLAGATGNVNYIVTPGTAGHCVQLGSDGISLVDSGTTSCGGGGGGALGYSASNVLTAATTYFLPPVGGAAASTTEANVQGRATSAAPIANLYVQLSAAPGVGNSLAFTFRDGGVGQALTCTVSGAATTCSDVTHSFTPATNDLIDIQMVDTGVTATVGVVLTFTYGASSSSAISAQSTNLGSNTLSPAGTGARLLGTTYHNTNTYPIFVEVLCSANAPGVNIQLLAQTDANAAPAQFVSIQNANGVSAGFWIHVNFWVLPGNFYKVTQANCDTSASTNGTFWTEWH